MLCPDFLSNEEIKRKNVEEVCIKKTVNVKMPLVLNIYSALSDKN